LRHDSSLGRLRRGMDSLNVTDAEKSEPMVLATGPKRRRF
jgi:hypothetical protein